MEGKSGNSTGSQCNLNPGKFSAKDDHQSVAVNVRERKFSDDRRKLCSSAECKTFLGEANRNRKSPQDPRTEVIKPETTNKYLQDSYNYAFQRHVDNLTKVISQHKNGSNVTDKTKTEVHIHPTENSKNSRNVSPKPLSKLEIKNDAGLNQKITFGGGGDDDDDEDEFQEHMKNLKKINVLTEKLQEETFFEELIEPHPMITFNHVCSETESDQISFNQIKANSRSPSPMLEVPGSKISEKMTTRPPL